MWIVSEQINRLIGKKFLVEPSGTSLTEEEKRTLDRLQPGAIMFRKRNFLQDAEYDVWLEAYRKLVNQIKDVVAHEKMIWSVDHEGGRVIRFPLPVTRFPYAAHFGEAAALVAEAMAIELKALGINVNFAPVADIHSNPENPVINERAFAKTAEQAGSLARLFAQVLHEHGVVPCAKHFPGHGDTKTDSHFGLPSLDLTMDELRRRELVPFQTLIDAGILMIMTAHILFPQVDPHNPATLSRLILNDLLRNEMGFSGVVIADAMGMAAVSGSMKKDDTVVKAVNAGLDIFLVAGDNVGMSDALHSSDHMQRALAAGEIREVDLFESASRIDRFISTLPQHGIMRLDDQIFRSHDQLASKLEAKAPWSDFDLSLPGFE